MTAAKVKEWQNLIAGISLALSIAYAATVLLRLSFQVGVAVQQHERILAENQQILSEVHRLADEIHEVAGRK